MVKIKGDEAENDPGSDLDHGETVKRLAEGVGGQKVQGKKYSSTASAKGLKNCFDTLKEDAEIEVVNFSSTLAKADDSAYQAFWELCQVKDVVVALGNNARLLNKDNDKPIPIEEVAGNPSIEEFLKGFTDWIKATDKVSEIDNLKLTLCENYKMHVNELTERSSRIDPEHPLASKVVGVRADCVINPITKAIESGTSYAAPLVAGALASAQNRDEFRKSLHATEGNKNITTWQSLSEGAATVEKDEAISIDDEDIPKKISGLGISTGGVERPNLSAKDLSIVREMQNMIPIPGESYSIKVR